MGEGHEFRWGGMAGIGAIVLAIVAFLIMGSPPTIMDSPGSIAAFLSDHRNQILTGALLYAIAIVLALWFGAALATAFRRADQTSDASAVVLAGYILVGAVGFIAISAVAGMTYAMTAHPDLLRFAVIPFTAVTVVGTVAGIAVALPMGASAVAIARTHVFPVWMAWFAGLVALVRVLAPFSMIGTGSTFVPGSVFVSYLPGALAGLWVLTASGLLIREHLPVITARTAPPVVGHA